MTYATQTLSDLLSASADPAQQLGRTIAIHDGYRDAINLTGKYPGLLRTFPQRHDWKYLREVDCRMWRYDFDRWRERLPLLVRLELDAEPVPVAPETFMDGLAVTLAPEDCGV